MKRSMMQFMLERVIKHCSSTKKRLMQKYYASNPNEDGSLMHSELNMKAKSLQFQNAMQPMQLALKRQLQETQCNFVCNMVPATKSELKKCMKKKNHARV
jgi:hypothetical protein